MAAAKKGRPSNYKPEFVSQAEKLCMLGATDEEIADFFEVDVRTVYRWKHEHADFCQALKIGKDALDNRVERSLYQKAIGYRSDAVKIFMPAGKDEPVYAPYVEHHQPDTTAAIFWLKNRRSQEWRDRHQTELTGADGGPIKTEGAFDRESARRLAFALAEAARGSGEGGSSGD